jgi:transaldolase
MNALDRLTALDTSIWVDALVGPVQLARLIREDGVTGLTSNPTILDHALAGGEAYQVRAARYGHLLPARGLLEALVISDMQALADVLAPVYERTLGLDGYVSLEVPPELAYDADGTVASARELWAKLDRPNAMIKVPGTTAGIEATARLIAEGINVNVTLLFSLEAYASVVEAYISGLEARLRAGRPIDRVASVASFFVSRVDTAVDALLAERGHSELEGLAAVANARLAYALAQEEFRSERFAKLRAAGAHPQRLLWASTGTKDPRYSDVKYVDELAGPGVINTMPLATLAAVHDHGDPADRLTGSETAAQTTLDAVRAAGVDLDSVTHKLLEDGVARFAASMDDLLLNLENAALAA